MRDFFIAEILGPHCSESVENEQYVSFKLSAEAFVLGFFSSALLKT